MLLAFRWIFPFACVWFALAGSDAANAQPAGRQYSTAQIQAGYRVHASQCATCHGQNGNTVQGVDLPRQQFKTVSTDDDIKNRITNGNATAGMPPFKLEPDELDGILAYIRSGFDLNATPFKVGDAGRGKTLFEAKGGCTSCHRVNGQGALTAPDLSDIGSLRQPAAIQRSLLEPTKGMVPMNRPVRIVTKDGRTIRGRRLNEDTFTVQLIDDGEHLVSLMKSDLSEYELGTASNMPSFMGKLSDDELSDLLAYLISLRG